MYLPPYRHALGPVIRMGGPAFILFVVNNVFRLDPFVLVLFNW